MIALDIGGTKVKYGIFGKSGADFGQFDVTDSKGCENVAASIVGFLKNYTPDCIGMSVPGPFDYEKGISHMKHKLTSLYGVNLGEMLKNEFPHTNVFFIHDARAFALGVMEENKSLLSENFSCLMLGTGIGYANVEKGVPKLTDSGTPKNPLWNMPFKDGIAEDYVSTRALIKSAEKKGYTFDNIKDMAECAKDGNTDLLGIFKRFGETLGECVQIKRKEHFFESVAIGGQISKSFDLMRQGFEKVSNAKIYVVKNPEKCALYGLKRFWRMIK